MAHKWCGDMHLIRECFRGAAICVDVNLAFRPSLVWHAPQTANMWEPFGTLPANSTAYWKPAPTERGTFGILSTCILTLLLCVYTCLHPNIPAHGVKEWYNRPWSSRAVWVFTGLFAPEFVSTFFMILFH